MEDVKILYKATGFPAFLSLDIYLRGGVLTKTFASVSIVWLGPEPALLSAGPDEGNAREPSQVLHKCYGNPPISSGTSNDESHEGPASAVSAWAVYEVSKTDTFFWPKKTKRNTMK